jgi:hypothetical protein
MRVRLGLRLDLRGGLRWLRGNQRPVRKSPRQGSERGACGSAQEPRRRDIPEIVLAMVVETRAIIPNARSTTTMGATFLRH